MTTQITGREPRLSLQTNARGEQRLSLRKLASMLNILPPDAVSLPALDEMLRNEEFYVRYNAAQMLGRRGDREARLIMQNALNSGETPTRASVARHLYGFSWFSAEPLLRQALQDHDTRVREAAIYALCDLRELNAYQLMTEILKAEGDDVKMAAAWGLRNSQDSAAVPVLEAVLSAEDPEVRIKGLEALGQNDTPEAMPVVRQAMNDPDPDVKYAATLSLLELAGEGWLQELSGIIGRTTGVTRQQILRGFFHATNYLKIDVAKTQSADLLIDALETALLDDMDDVRMAVVWPLAWMRHDRTPASSSAPIWSNRVKPSKRIWCGWLPSLMSDAADEILQDALKHSGRVRQVADQIMQDRGGRPPIKYETSAMHASAGV
ncbi:MAG: HEAT repeat domain-containing protein [Chloroflexi bacterium]|uniref:HEAT repeat domain-containing protein n=1 Tax=Candidatus Flexifilum breve TaxID=3140694 RepID=UPI0031369C09|nr:HEAT repeat domain-containing protein [Chloroflexota bacterium]